MSEPLATLVMGNGMCQCEDDFRLGCDTARVPTIMGHHNHTNEQAAWVGHSDVVSHFGVDRKTLRVLMKSTPEHIHRPWVDLGERRPTYRWKRDELDLWFERVTSWRSSQRDRAATGRSSHGFP